MNTSRRFFALAAFGVAGLVPGLAVAQSDAGSQDLMRRLRGAPSSRVGGATRGVKRDHADQANDTPVVRPTAPVQPVPAATRSASD